MNQDADMKEEYLFVYGTLRNKFHHPMSELLRNQAEFMGEAKMKGRLFNLGSYPGMTEGSADEHLVTGDVYKIHSPAIWEHLDDYEGIGPAYPEPYEYERTIRQAIIGDQCFRCNVYFVTFQPDEQTLIRSGDFLNR